MDMNSVLTLFSEYGLIILFVIVFLEYMNLPGLPAGIIMPAAGVLVAQSQLNIVVAILASVVAGVLGSLVLYALGYYGGVPLLEKMGQKSEKVRKFTKKCTDLVETKGDIGLVICRLIPVLRTIVSIPAGVFKVPVHKFIMLSTVGIFGWNLALILFGFFFGQVLLK